MQTHTGAAAAAATPAGGKRSPARKVPAARRLLTVLLVMAIALLAAGCGEDEGQLANVPVGGKASAEQQKQSYEESMDRMRSQLEDANAPALERSIAAGNKRQLEGAALRWDSATATVASIDPPADIASAHRDLVKAMKGLGDWNRKIAAGAPNKSRTRRLARQAQASKDAAAFQAAITKIEARGYHVMSEPDSSDPLGDAGSPVN